MPRILQYGLRLSALTFALTTTPYLASAQSTEWALGTETNFSRFDGATYDARRVGNERGIRTIIETRFGLPVEAARYPLSSDGAAISIFFDPQDELISYVDGDGQTKPSIDDQIDGRQAVIALFDGNGTGYIIGLGTIFADEAVLEDIDEFSFVIAPFMINQDGEQAFVTPTSQISEEARRDAGYTTAGEFVLGADQQFAISLVTGPRGGFIEVKGPQYVDGQPVHMTYLTGIVDTE